MTAAEHAMPSHFLIAVRLHDGRYHGAGDHPPEPARLFQALVAGVGLGGPDALAGASPTLEWLESLSPPTVAVPFMMKGQSVKTYVPNNDLDARGGDPSRVGEVRTEKMIRPWLFDDGVPLLYVWELCAGEEDDRAARTACELSEHLYQFGRGVDMAWAWGELLDGLEVEERLRRYPGQIFRPSHRHSATILPCPAPGTLASLKMRFAAGAHRFRPDGEGKQLFMQQPKPHFVEVPYDSPPSLLVFDLQKTTDQSALGVWPLARASKLVVLLRDAAAARLARVMPSSRAAIERFMVGRKPGEADAAVSGSRIRIVPMPSIGHQHADHGIRRVLVEVPASCPLRSDDVRWAFSGLDVIDSDTGEVFDLVLAPSSDFSLLSHYCASGEGAGFRVWRSVTPAALPESAKRRRIRPTRARGEEMGGRERVAEEACAAASVYQALRHAQVVTNVDSVKVQREPFEGKGGRAESFGVGTRFDDHRLWHVEVSFSEPVRGPLVIGDGRFLGLGVFAPAKRRPPAYAFVVEDGLGDAPDSHGVSRALRRAVMARVQAALSKDAELPTFFSGHEANGAPGGSAEHLTFAFDPVNKRLLIVAPHAVGRRRPTRREDGWLEVLDHALVGFNELRAGRAGRLTIRAVSVDVRGDPLFAPARIWETVTPYQVTRHAKKIGASKALAADVRVECRRHGLPDVRVTSSKVRGVPGVGVVGQARLDFGVAVEGPIILGRSRHCGGGLFSGRMPVAS